MWSKGDTLNLVAVYLEGLEHGTMNPAVLEVICAVPVLGYHFQVSWCRTSTCRSNTLPGFQSLRWKAKHADPSRSCCFLSSFHSGSPPMTPHVHAWYVSHRRCHAVYCGPVLQHLCIRQPSWHAPDLSAQKLYICQCTTSFGSTTKVLAKRLLKYYRIS